MFSAVQKISINGDIFYIHEHILKETTAFAYLFDTSIESKIPPNLEISRVVKSEIERIFSLLYAKQSLLDLSMVEKGQTVLTFSKISRIMMVIGIRSDIIDDYICETIKCNDNFLLEMVNQMEYEDYFLLVAELYSGVHDIPYIKSITLILVDKKFPDRFCLKILTKLICKIYLIKDFDYILAITHDYHDLGNTIRKCLSRDDKHINSTFHKTICDIYKNFFNADVKFGTADSNLKVSEITINGKPLNIIHKKTTTAGTFGSNILKTIAVHVAEILLGIKQL